ncbi:hypothetical protein D3C87_1949390 [compost metagenome]
MIGIADIPLEQLSEVTEELNVQRLVQSHVLADFVDCLLRGLFPGQHDCGIARQYSGENECDHDNPEQGRNHLRQSF